MAQPLTGVSGNGLWFVCVSKGPSPWSKGPGLPSDCSGHFPIRKTLPCPSVPPVHSKGCTGCLLASGKESSHSKPWSAGRKRLEGEGGDAPSTTRTPSLGAKTKGKSKLSRGVCCGHCCHLVKAPDLTVESRVTCHPRMSWQWSPSQGS